VHSLNFEHEAITVGTGYAEQPVEEGLDVGRTNPSDVGELVDLIQRCYNVPAGGEDAKGEIVAFYYPSKIEWGGRDACEKKQSGNGRSLSGITHLLIRSDPPRSELERRLAVEFDSKEQLKEEWVEVTSTKKVTTREKVLIDLRYASCGT